MQITKAMKTDLSFRNSISAHSPKGVLLHILMKYLGELWASQQKSHIQLPWYVLFIFNKTLGMTIGKVNWVVSYL